MDGPQGRGYTSFVKRAFGRRPPRLKHIFATTPLYFDTFCTHERKRVLTTNEVHSAFVRFAKRAEKTSNVAVGRYVIMPDHVHLIVRGDDNFRLGPWIGALKQALAKAAMLSRLKGQTWEERFFDHILRNDEKLFAKVELRS